MKDPKDNLNSDFKEGDVVIITGNNEAMPGGNIGWNAIGKECVLEAFVLKDERLDRGRVLLKEGQKGYWRTSLRRDALEHGKYVFNVTQFRHKEEKKAYGDMLLKDLRVLAKQAGIKNVNDWRKAGLIVQLKMADDKKKKEEADKLEAAKKAKEALENKKSVGEQFTNKVKLMKSVCHFCIEGEKGNSDHINAPCHAQMGYFRRDLIGNVVNVWEEMASHDHHHPDKAAYKKFYMAMLNDMPWSNIYSTKKWEDAIREGVRFDAKTLNRHQIVWGQIALREGSEFPWMASSVASCLDSGMPPVVAWIIGTTFEKKNGTFNYKPRTGGHQCLTPSMTKADDLLLFLKQGFHLEDVLKEKPLHNSPGAYLVTQAVARNTTKEKTFSKLIEELFEIKNTGFGVATANIKEKDFYKRLEAFEALLK